MLGYYLSFDAPSVCACMGVLRDVVSRFERLPSRIMVDGGAEFRSPAFTQLLDAYGVTVVYRRKSRPTDGGFGERIFGIANTELVHNLQGNAKALRDPRSMSPELDPRARAVWTLANLERLLEHYLFEVYNNDAEGDGKESPRERMERGWREAGHRHFKKVAYDAKFYVLSLPPHRIPPTVYEGGRIRVENLDYCAEELKRLKGKRVEVRIDPDDASHVFAELKRGAVECRNSHYRLLRGRSVRAVRLASQELRAGASRRGAGVRRPEAPEIARVLDAAKRYERLAERLARDEERREADAALGRVAPLLAGDVAQAQLVSPSGETLESETASGSEGPRPLTRTYRKLETF